LAQRTKVRPVLLDRGDPMSTRAHESLRGLILNGAFSSGERLNEVELAASLGISRAPLREALQRLGTEGLVRLVSHRGAFIPDFSEEEIEHLYELREALETMGARLAVRRSTDREIQRLRELLDDTAALLHEGNDAPYPEQLDFHQRVVAMSHNTALIDRSREVDSQLHLVRAQGAYKPARAKTALQEHQRIVTAIAARDEDAAGATMRDHLCASHAHAQQLIMEARSKKHSSRLRKESMS